MNDIYTDINGEGYPLVLVHGYFGSSNMWCNQKKTFSKHSSYTKKGCQLLVFMRGKNKLI